MPAPSAPSRVEDHLTDAQTAADTLVGTFVGSICQSGQSTLRLGEDLLADWLGYDVRDEESRQQMRRTTAIGAGGLFGLGFLLGTRTGRSVLRDVVVLGGAAILGKAAVDAGAALVDRISDPAPRKVSLLASVIARATDGREVTQDEMRRIDARLEALPEARRQALLEKSTDRIHDADELTERIEDPALRREVFAISALLCGSGSDEDKQNLGRLARAFGYDDEQARLIRAEAGLS